MYVRALHRRLAGAKANLLVLGPRQVGKSTLLNGLNPDLTIQLASPQTFRDYVSRPERLEAELRAAPDRVHTVLIDEVQRVPSLLDALQVVIDERPRRFRFLLSGSSARKLKRGHANLLPGRIHVHSLHPLLASEIGDDFQLERALAHGTLPGIYSESDPSDRAQTLRGYVDVYLREEIQAEALVRNLGGFSLLLDLVAASSGRILNMSSLSRESGIRFETIRRYFEILEDTLLLHRVPAWSHSERKASIAHPKLYLFDLGVRNALLRRPLDRCLDDERGLLLEHFVAQELLARVGTLWPELAVFHYRTKGGAEVDFVLEVGRELWAVEVKASRNVSREDLSGIASLAERTRRLKRKIVVFLGPRRQKLEDVEVLPLKEFLESLPS